MMDRIQQKVFVPPRKSGEVWLDLPFIVDDAPRLCLRSGDDAMILGSGNPVLFQHDSHCLAFGSGNHLSHGLKVDGRSVPRIERYPLHLAATTYLLASSIHDRVGVVF